VSVVLGISVGADAVRAVLRKGPRLAWVGSARYSGPDDLSDVLARLAGEAAEPVRRARVVLERDAVQVRTLPSVPGLHRAALRESVLLQCGRLFRNGHGPMTADARVVVLGRRERVVVAAAAPESLVAAIADGCEQAGLVLDALGPACDVLPSAVDALDGGPLAVPTAAGAEHLDLAGRTVWRSRLLRAGSLPAPAWKAPLAALGADAATYASAFAAASATPRLSLLPPSSRARRAARERSRRRTLAIAACLLWTLAAGVFLARLGIHDAAVHARLAELAPAAAGALTLRRDLSAAQGAMGTIERATLNRSRLLPLLATLTERLGDSVTLVSVRVTRDSVLHLSGYAPVADRIVAALEHTPGLAAPRLEAPPDRQALGGSAASGRQREWDRFAVVARLRAAP
jgi:hypothetical protein